MDDQPALFSALDDRASWPAGLDYRPEFLSEAEERELTGRIGVLPLKPFEFHGFLGHRRVISFGWQYVFDGSGLRKTDDIPDFLLPVRDRAAAYAGLEPDAFGHVLLTEYAPGAGIGWHRDRSVFGDVAGISLLSPTRLRFRRRVGKGWERTALRVEPRSIYLLRGEAREAWEHGIVPGERLRYSITFRSLRQTKTAPSAEGRGGSGT